MQFTTDVIAGFPGESEAEFAGTLDFIRGMEFAGGHVFNYSARPGTPAARLSRQVPLAVRRERSTRLREVFEAAARAYRERFLGRTLPVLWEATDQLSDRGWRLEGLTDNYLRVTAFAPQPLWNVISPVEITGLEADGLSGVIR